MKNTNEKIITIQDIADALGISRNTASKALNGKYVPEKTRKQVLEKARELNYKSMLEINHNETKSHRILILSGRPLNNINYFYAIIKSIENYCFKHNHQLFQYTFTENANSYEILSQYFSSLKINGIICIETFEKNFIKKILDFHIPTCFIDFNYIDDYFEYNYDIVQPDNWNPVFCFVNENIQNEKMQHFCYVGDNKHCLSFSQRYLAMLTALTYNKIEHQNSYDITIDDSEKCYSNPQLFKDLIIDKVPFPNCFICANDDIAKIVIYSLNLLKKQIPNEVMVLGFDDSFESKLGGLSLSTVSVDKQLLGLTTIQTLINRIENPNSPSSKIYVKTKIIQRETTK